MSHTTETLADYLGGGVSAVLADPPFNSWAFEKSFETDLEKPCIDYVFAQNGVDFVCDGDEKITSIFLYFDDSRRFEKGLKDLPFTSTRHEVVERLGSPSKSGGRISDPILGEYGPWDLFARHGYAVHIEYRLDADAIKKITLMRADVVP